eukprot:m.215338 g.215338  ORF g.215338 m.215338 type:complete len:64 (-) comp33186_c2_seq12:527-718(-)
MPMTKTTTCTNINKPVSTTVATTIPTQTTEYNIDSNSQAILIDYHWFPKSGSLGEDHSLFDIE